MKLEPNTRYLIIHADDGGLCHSVNSAMITALESRIVTSASLMVPCPQFNEIAKFFKQNPQYDVGIHFTLTCEYPHYPWPPVADKNKVSSLVNRNGYLKTKKEFINDAKPEDVAIELRAQIERFLESGIKPSHLDTHQGTVFQDLRFLESYVKLGMEYKILPMLLKLNEHTLKMINVRSLKIDENVIKDLMGLGIPFLDFLFMADDNSNSLKNREQEYMQVISQLPGGLSQIIIHPGFDDEELKNITSQSRDRYYDFSVFTDLDMKQFISDQNIKLISWRDLAGFN